MKQQRVTPITYAHPMVAQTAREMAAAIYEECATKNWWYKMNPDQNAFVAREAQWLLESARATLASMLANPTYHRLHEEIHDALMLDNTLRQGRVRRRGRVVQ